MRFACGHALVCNGCLPVVVAQYKKCPTCDRPFGVQPVAERGRHVRVAPTFVRVAQVGCIPGRADASRINVDRMYIA